MAKLETINLIIEKCKTQRDGVYRFKGITYRVKDNRLRLWAEGGKIMEEVFGMSVHISSYDVNRGSYIAAVLKEFKL